MLANSCLGCTHELRKHYSHLVTFTFLLFQVSVVRVMSLLFMVLKVIGFIFGVSALPGNENMVRGSHVDTENDLK